MYELLIKCDRDINVIIAGQIVFVAAKKAKLIQIEKLSEFDFQFFCNGFDSVIQCAKVFVDNQKIVKCSDNLRVVQLTQKTYFVEISAKKHDFLHKKVKKIVKNGIFFNFFQNGAIEIENETSLLFCESYHFLTSDADVLELKNGCYALKLFGENKKEKSVILNQNYSSVVELESAIVEPTENGFKVLTDLHDIARHGIVETFEIDDDIVKVDEYSVYLSGAPQNKFNPNVLPTYFLQCIKANDFKEAKNCLSVNLSQKVKPEHLKNYFGNFDDILQQNEKIYLVALCVDGSNVHSAKQISFVMANGLIDNIIIL